MPRRNKSNIIRQADPKESGSMKCTGEARMLHGRVMLYIGIAYHKRYLASRDSGREVDPVSRTTNEGF
jgi:hypothetical protein